MTITIPSPPGYSSPYAAHSTSPLTSSPLSQPPITPGLKPKRRKSSGAHVGGVPIPSRRRPSVTHLTPSPSARTPPSPTALSATTPSPPPSSLSRSHPLLGSYQLSLLHSRMSQHAPHATDRFGLQLRAMGRGAGCPAALRAPAPINLPLAATYYDLSGGEEAAPRPAGAAHSPWVADVDLEGWYFDRYTGADEASAPPPFPGYRVAAVGQLQILVRTASAAVKVFVIPYDLRKLDDGARLLARERTYVAQPEPAGAAATTPPRTRECLRYAVQLQFACAHDSDGERGYYVARAIKLVFTASPPEREAAVRVERADEVVPAPARSPTKKTHARASFSRSSLGGAGRTKEDWALIRAKWLARAPDAVRGFTPEPDSAIRGFTPEPSRPATPLAPLQSPRSLLTALAPAEERGAEVRSRSRSPSGSGGSATSRPDTPLDGARARLRAASPVTHRRRSVRVERELSERLRAMELGGGADAAEHRGPESLE
ncbi:hypothetical protein Q8F55_000585 [Vanrija albida]|uniref:Atos-like conserved domain-containing protein n=1 Tax=Vanrija albida TaxID=181172 RepID=A0ABR3QDP8_9TREE